MSQNLVSVIYTTSVEKRREPFVVDEHFFSERDKVRFNIKYHGLNFRRWFEGSVIEPEPSNLVFSSNFHKAFHEEEIMENIGKVDSVSLATVYNLLESNSMLIGHSNLFFSNSPITDEIHLLVLLSKGGMWSVRGYDEKVRKDREWFSGLRVLSMKPL